MQELDKIMEEFRCYICRNLCYYTEIIVEESEMEEICDRCKVCEYLKDIRKYMSDSRCGECSRRKWYQKGYEDGKKNNDGWIPVEKRDHLPEAGEHVLVSIGPGFNSEKAFLSEDRRWMMLHAPEGYNDITDLVEAWRPLPEPYRPERSDGE